jgi:DNA-binding NarL/FixJ family response regulator
MNDGGGVSMPSPAPRSMHQTHSPEPQLRHGAAPIRLLIVDDSERIRRGLHGVFELLNDVNVVAEAIDGLEAIALVREFLPDVVLIDAAMPVMGGIEATRRIRAIDPHLRIIMVTAMPGQEQSARAAGADAFLLKDADPLEIIRAVRSLP